MIPKLWELLEFSLTSLNTTIIWSYQNAARIEKPYVVVNYTTVDVPDHDHYGLVNETGIRINASHRMATVDLQFYCARDSYSLASKAAMLLANNASIDKQWLLDVSIGSRMNLQRIPVLLNASQYEDRALYTFNFYYTEAIDDDVGLIETVVLNGTYEGEILHPGEITCSEVVSKQDVYVDHRNES